MPLLTRRQVIVGAATLAVGWPARAARGLSINPRSSWATNRPPLGPLAAEDVRFLIVHHSASRNGHTGSDAPGILRAFYDFHTGTRGWNDIAYNFLIDADGGIWEGRAGSLDGPVAGDATGGNQGFTQLVCVIGDYNSAVPSQAALNSLVALLAWLADRYGVSTSPGATVTFESRGSNVWPAGTSVTTPTINGHRAMSQTSCPGDNLWAYVAGDLTADVDLLRSGGSPTPVTPPTTTTTTVPATTTAPTTSTTLAQTTTTVAQTTTTIPPTTTVVETTVSSTSPTSTSIPAAATTLRPAATVPVAVEAGDDATGGWPWLVLGLVSLLGGAAAWRQKRLR